MAKKIKLLLSMNDDLKKLIDRDIVISGHSELLFRESIESADSTDLSDLPDLEIVPEDSEDYNPTPYQIRLALLLRIPSSASVQGDPFCQRIFPSELPRQFYDGETLFVGERATGDIQRQNPLPIRKDGAN